MQHVSRFLILAVMLMSSMLGYSVKSGAATIDVKPKAEIKASTGIPVLCYHRFGPYKKKDPYFLPIEEFKGQLEIIKEEGFTVITARQLAEGLKKPDTLPAKPLVISIDDGYKDFIKHAKPLLDQFGYKATLYIYTDFVGAKLGFSKKQLRELEAEGFDIGSHSASHPKLSKKKKQETEEHYLERLKKEMSGSRKKLQEWSQGPVKTIGYPYGLWNAAVAKAGKEAGYDLMFTVCPGMNTIGDETVRWHRFMILRGTRERTFRSLLRQKPLSVQFVSPVPGQLAKGPLTKMELVLPEELRSKINSKSFKARSGQTIYPLQYDETSGRILIQLTKPWRNGADQVRLSVNGKDNKTRYATSWLVQVKTQGK